MSSRHHVIDTLTSQNFFGRTEVFLVEANLKLWFRVTDMLKFDDDNLNLTITL